MKKALWVILIVVVAIAAGSQLIPAHWKVSRSTVIQATPQTIYPLIADWKNWDKWAAFKVPDAVFTHSGAPSGVGAVCVVKNKSMEITNQIVKADPATGISYECLMPGWPKADGNISFSPEAGGTRVDYSYEGVHSHNPMERIIGLFMLPTLGKAFEEGLANLKKLAETKAGK